MNARQWLIALVLLVVLGHLVAPFLVLLIAGEVLAAVAGCVALGWLLATARAVPRKAAQS